MNRLVIADQHEPFTYPTYLRFCKDMYVEHDCEEAILIGDIIDNHALSRFTSNPDGFSPGHEYEATKKKVKLWHDAFPGARVLIGNHDARSYLRAAEAGIPKAHMRDWNEIWKTPTWTWAPSFNVDGVKYVHGTRSSGPTAALRRAIAARQSLVMGHTHSFAGVQYHASRKDLIFGLNVGWGGDDKSYAFEYGAEAPNRGCVGCGLVCNRAEAYWLPAALKGKYRRRKR